jgi:hypothetical protein
MRRIYLAPTIIAVLACAVLVRAQDPEPSAVQAAPDPAALADRLEAAKEERIDVELKTGRSLIRCQLMQLTRDKKTKGLATLKLLEGDTGKKATIGFASIRTITIGRDKIYEAAADKPAVDATHSKAGEKSGKSAANPRLAKGKKGRKPAEPEGAWIERAKKNGVEPWPELSGDEHKAALGELQEMIADIQKSFIGMELYETGEFLFLSNMPRQQVIPYAASLDKMYDLMCQMYGIKKGTAVFQGKCLVVAFLEQAEFQRFELQFFELRVPNGVYGLCHSASSGRVVMSCYRGDDALEFAHMLVHETSHGFIHRYRTAHRLPSWANEGMAEWIGRALVPASDSIPIKEHYALGEIRSTGSLDGMLTTERINSIQYGMAYSLTNYLIQTDQEKYTTFVNGMKEGQTWEDSLKNAYNATPEQLLAGYGRSIGVPNLQP